MALPEAGRASVVSERATEYSGGLEVRVSESPVRKSCLAQASKEGIDYSWGGLRGGPWGPHDEAQWGRIDWLHYGVGGQHGMPRSAGQSYILNKEELCTGHGWPLEWAPEGVLQTPGISCHRL